MYYLNNVHLQGEVVEDFAFRELPASTQIVFDLRVSEDQSVPIVVPEGAPVGPALLRGAEVAVFGEIKRRYYRVGGATQSRTEVVAYMVTPATL